MTLTPLTILEECSTIAFYGIDVSTEAISNFYDFIVTCFTGLDYPPDLLAIEGIGFSGKPIGFTRIHKRLQKTGFSEVTSFSLYSSLPEAKIPRDDYFLMCALDRESVSCALISIRLNIANFTDRTILNIAQLAIKALNPSYGIGYIRDNKLSPSLYAFGICHGQKTLTDDAYDQVLNSNRWGNLAMKRQVYRQGVIRDVFPWNFLTEDQLSAKVGKIPLREWIQQSPAHGLLTKFTDNVWLWEVEEATIARVREPLWNEKIIFNWKNYV